MNHTRRALALGASFVLLAAVPAGAQYHSADSDQTRTVNLSELLRIIQFFNTGALHCDSATEDGYAPGTFPLPPICEHHSSDYAPADWSINLTELLRAIQFFNAGAYHIACDTEDGYRPGPGEDEVCGGEGEGEGEWEGYYEIEGAFWEGEGEGEGEEVSEPGTYGGGSGSAEDPYIIATPAHLVEMGRFIHRIDWDKHFALTQDIDMAGVADFSPIGQGQWHYWKDLIGVPFTGHFAGGGHIVRNLTIDTPDSDCVGLFGYVEADGVIQDLGVVNATIRGREDVGALAGNFRGELSRCFAVADVTGSSYAGGLAGALVDATVTSCYARGTVASGYMAGGLAAFGSGLITACYAAVAVTADPAGGLLGWGREDGVTNGCFWDVDVAGLLESLAGRGLTTSDLQKPLYLQYAGWADYDWVMEAGAYPILAWQDDTLPPIPELGPVPLAGSGTVEDPYRVGSVADFTLLSWHPGVLDAHIRLDADIDFGGAALYPIGVGTPFTGTFDGDGHTLRDFVFSRPGHFIGCGLFAAIGSAGVVRELNIETEAVAVRGVFGLLAGRNEGLVESCLVSASATQGPWERFGMLVGENSGTVRMCGAAVSIHASGCGGLVHMNDGVIESSYFKADVSGDSAIAWFVSKNTGQIRTSYSMVEAIDESSADFEASFCSSNSGTIVMCYASGASANGLVDYSYELEGATASFGNADVSGPEAGSQGWGLTTSQLQEVQLYQYAGWGGNGWVMEEGSYPRLVWENTGAPPIPPPGAPPVPGSGTEADPYRLETPADFALFTRHVGFLDAHTVVSAELDCTGLVLYPIGDLGEFTGVLDGGGHAIRNLHLELPFRKYVALFVHLYPDAVVKNLRLVNASIHGGYETATLAQRNDGLIADCFVDSRLEGGPYLSGAVEANYGVIRGTQCTIAIEARARAGLVSHNYGLIERCHSEGQLPAGCRGGLVSVNESEGIIRQSTAAFDLSEAWHTGLLAGLNMGLVEDCAATGSVSGGGTLGGLAGTNAGVVSNSTFSGSVTGTESNLGGLLGANKGTVSRCAAFSDVSGQQNVGGLVGYQERDGTVSQSYATGTVLGVRYVGGLIGQIWHPSYGIVMAEDCHAASDVVGSTMVGGFAGLEYGVVNRCYAVGSVAGQDDTGGFAGYSTRDGEALFWDVETSGRDTSSSGVGLTTAEMMQRATFEEAGWDFDTVWAIDEGTSYPYLQWTTETIENE
ncbi:MAG: GLUG motif-containing protein [Candidatus Hydrogenedentota bacterium]